MLRNASSNPHDNASHVDDPRIQHAVKALTPVLPNSLKSVASRWRALDRWWLQGVLRHGRTPNVSALLLRPDRLPLGCLLSRIRPDMKFAPALMFARPPFDDSRRRRP